MVLTGFALQVGEVNGQPPQDIVPPLDTKARNVAVLPETPKELKETTLNAKERKGLNLARKWMDGKEMPWEENGKVVYPYGATLPSVVCAPLRTCDVELQPGEVVRDVHVGDSVRWKVAPAKSGSAGNETMHLVIKPVDHGLSTSLIVTTDRRVYHMKLVSRKNSWMPSVGFSYPDDVAQWDSYYREAKRRQGNKLAGGQSVENLDFHYRIEGKAEWKPLRVFNDGVKTYIQMPKTMEQTEAPALLVIGQDKKEALVNYRVHGDQYIVDQIFQQAVLIAGVGRQQTKITIKREAQNE
jgi:type IV secretion system protein VirB9